MKLHKVTGKSNATFTVHVIVSHRSNLTLFKLIMCLAFKTL